MLNKRIILVRHGKSAWENAVSDRDRPLKNKGISDATLISTEFEKKVYRIDKIYSSPANRALSTCKIFANHLNWKQHTINIEETLYDFSGENVMHFIKALDNELNTVIIFGHNHAFTSVANLCGDRFIDNVPTSGLVVLKFNIDDWQHAKFGHTELIMFPRDFKS